MTSAHARGPNGPWVVGGCVGFAYLSDQMGGHGDARARELTLALGRVVGA